MATYTDLSARFAKLTATIGAINTGMIMQTYYWFSILIVTNGLLLFLLMINVSRLRMKHQVAYGDGGNKQLMTSIRVHANGTEQVPIFALATLALTFAGATELILSSLVIIFTLSRFIHAYGMLFRSLTLRQAGAGISYISQGAAILALLVFL